MRIFIDGCTAFGSATAGKVNGKLAAAFALVVLPVSGAYAMGYDVGGDALGIFNAAVSGALRFIGI